MLFEPVSSSAISHLGWHDIAGLIVRFNSSNKIWAYQADWPTYIAIKNAGSIGKEFDRLVKKTRLPGAEISEDELQELLAGQSVAPDFQAPPKKPRNPLEFLAGLLKSRRPSAYF